MGYDTEYELTGDISDDFDFSSLDDPYTAKDLMNGNDPDYWHEWKKDMKAISEFHPNRLFTLTGYGEENGDIWRAYFMNGKCQIENAQIIFGELDEDKLK